MEPINILHLVEPSAGTEKQKKTTTETIFRFLLFIFMLSWAALLTSCFVAVPVSRHPPRPGFIIEQNGHDEHHDNGRHEGRKNKEENQDYISTP